MKAATNAAFFISLGGPGGEESQCLGRYAYKIDYVNHTDTLNVEKLINPGRRALNAIPQPWLEL